MCRAFRRLGGTGRALVPLLLLLPLLALGGALLPLAWACYAPPGGAFAQFATLDWYRQYLAARPPFRLAFAPFGALDARWGDWRDPYMTYALTGVAPAVPRGRTLLWRGAAVALPVALGLYALGCLQLACARAAWPALAARAAAWPRPLARALPAVALIFPWAWAWFYLALVAAPLPPPGDGPALAAYLLLDGGNPALTKRHDLQMWAVVSACAALWSAEAALLLALARGCRARARPASGGEGG